jgi:hypothetical protein
MLPPSRLWWRGCAVYVITINATGHAAVLSPAACRRNRSRLRSDCPLRGLVRHLYEEHQKPAMRAIWDAAEHAMPYEAAEGSVLGVYSL